MLTGKPSPAAPRHAACSPRRMTRDQVTERLTRAEAELQRAQLEHDGSGRATVRYQAARQELWIAEALARALLSIG